VPNNRRMGSILDTRKFDHPGINTYKSAIAILMILSAVGCSKNDELLTQEMVIQCMDAAYSAKLYEDNCENHRVSLKGNVFDQKENYKKYVVVMNNSDFDDSKGVSTFIVEPSQKHEYWSRGDNVKIDNWSKGDYVQIEGILGSRGFSGAAAIQAAIMSYAGSPYERATVDVSPRSRCEDSVTKQIKGRLGQDAEPVIDTTESSSSDSDSYQAYGWVTVLNVGRSRTGFECHIK
jgi:hypothetical protein